MYQDLLSKRVVGSYSMCCSHYSVGWFLPSLNILDRRKVAIAGKTRGRIFCQAVPALSRCDESPHAKWLSSAVAYHGRAHRRESKSESVVDNEPAVPVQSFGSQHFSMGWVDLQQALGDLTCYHTDSTAVCSM